jgi:type I restriction enzyme S subunit
MILKDICVVDWGNTELTKSSYVENGRFLAVSAAGCDGKINHYEHESDVSVLSAIGSQCGKMFFPNTKFTAIKNTITLKPKENVLGKYIFYLFTSINLPKRGTGQPFISKGDIEKFVIPQIPPLPIQQKIVAKLDKIFAEIDKAVAAAEANVINVEILFKSYLKKAFLLHGKNFKEYSIGDVCKVIGGGTPSKSNNQFYQGNIPWATVGDMNQEIIEKTKFKITNDAVTKSSTNVILKNNVIIATRVGLGKICIIKSDTAINQDLKAVIPLDLKVLEIYYLFFWFKSIANLIIEAGRGSTVNGVKLDFIKSLKIKIPNIDIQKNIINSINNIKHNVNYIILTNNKKIIELKLLKQSILQQAFNGELGKAA